VAPAPSICLAMSVHAPAALVEAFLVGCEEEGVPVVTHIKEGEAERLARGAAARSDLFVGGGIDERGTVAVHEHRSGACPTVVLVRKADVEAARAAGGDAARLVVGRRLRSENRR
jgi:hypothetical protein